MLETDAFARALRPLLSRSAGYARAMLGERAQAEDAVQQAALKAWERRAQFDTGQPFPGWWFGLLRNHCLDELRRRGRAPRAVTFETAEIAVPPDEGAVDRRALRSALARLSDMHREILELRYFADLDYDGLAQALTIPKGTVMSRLHLARKALAAQIAPEDL